MKFTIIHKHAPEAKQAVEAFIIDAVKKGHRFHVSPTRTPFFQTLPNYPSLEELNNIPFDVQVSEVEVVNVGQIITRKSLVIDTTAEVVIDRPVTRPTSTEISSENTGSSSQVIAPQVETPLTGSSENTGSI